MKYYCHPSGHHVQWHVLISLIFFAQKYKHICGHSLKLSDSMVILVSTQKTYFSTKLIVLEFNDMSTLVGHFVLSPREREKRDRWDSSGDKREGQGRKRNRNESEETEEIKTFPYPYLLQGMLALPNCKPISVGRLSDVRYTTLLSHPTTPILVQKYIGLDKNGYQVNIFLISQQYMISWRKVTYFILYCLFKSYIKVTVLTLNIRTP